MAAMPIPLWCGYDFDEDSLACMIRTIILLSRYNGGWLLSFSTHLTIPKIIVFYQLQPSLLCQQYFKGVVDTTKLLS